MQAIISCSDRVPAVLYGMLQKVSTLPQGSKRLAITVSMPRAPHFHHFQFSYISYLAALWPPATPCSARPKASYRQADTNQVSIYISNIPSAFSEPHKLHEHWTRGHCSDHSLCDCSLRIHSKQVCRQRRLLIARRLVLNGHHLAPSHQRSIFNPQLHIYDNTFTIISS